MSPLRSTPATPGACPPPSSPWAICSTTWTSSATTSPDTPPTSAGSTTGKHGRPRYLRVELKFWTTPWVQTRNRTVLWPSLRVSDDGGRGLSLPGAGLGLPTVGHDHEGAGSKGGHLLIGNAHHQEGAIKRISLQRDISDSRRQRRLARRPPPPPPRRSSSF